MKLEVLKGDIQRKKITFFIVPLLITIFNKAGPGEGGGGSKPPDFSLN